MTGWTTPDLDRYYTHPRSGSISGLESCRSLGGTVVMKSPSLGDLNGRSPGMERSESLGQHLNHYTRRISVNGNSRDGGPWMVKLFRACTTRKMGLFVAAVLASASILMVLNEGHDRRQTQVWEPEVDLAAAAGQEAEEVAVRSTDSLDSIEKGAAEESGGGEGGGGVGDNRARGFDAGSGGGVMPGNQQLRRPHEVLQAVAVLTQDAPRSRQGAGGTGALNTGGGETQDGGESGSQERGAGATAGGTGASESSLEREREGKSGTTTPPSNLKRSAKGGLWPGRFVRDKKAPPPVAPDDPDLPAEHMCHSFAIPAPLNDKKKSGFRPCPVCYLPSEQAVDTMPAPGYNSDPVLQELTFATQAHPTEVAAGGPKFAGHATWEDRAKSYSIREKMEVHCGFVWGERPGKGTGFDIEDVDLEFLAGCRGVVVSSAIFGAYDNVQPPSNVGEYSHEQLCFIMFVDEETHVELLKDGTLGEGARSVGPWRIVIVRNLPYSDPRRNGKVPKLLIHRLAPNARFSLWVDAKLQLKVDPYRILERFLWRHNYTWAISKHYKRFDVFVEAEANKAAGKYHNRTIDEQINTYRTDGLTPWSPDKRFGSDVPEGCFIVRALTPLSNLMGCLWFNEVDRFTSRDQLSFGYVRDKILSQVDWRVSMFQDCERRNFVVQAYHKPLLQAGTTPKGVSTSSGRGTGGSRSSRGQPRLAEAKENQEVGEALAQDNV